MIVVSDTSPLTALLAVGAQEALRQLFMEVVIPEAVRNELSKTHPALPEWIRVVAVRNVDQVRQYALIVDVGEAEAIELARELELTVS